MAVHPRVCGELVMLECRPAVEIRFIPACAGNSWLGTRRWLTSSAHPRVCGELLIDETRALLDDGSSPRVRGTRRGVFAEQAFERFIPACAGNSEDAA